MAPQETGKQRAGRIPLDYYKRPDNLGRRKLRLTLVAFALSALCLLGGLLLSNESQRFYTRGPVASVHATWDQNCNVCHTAFEPLSADNVWRSVGFTHKVADTNCQSCHLGPDHTNNQMAAEVQSCSACHAEHQGRDGNLLRMSDRECTKCHADLSTHSVKSPIFQDRVSDFSLEGHPQFKLFRGAKPVDPGRLKFNHRLHMTRGLTRPGDEHYWTLAHVDAKDRKRFGKEGEPEGTPVQLECAACHQRDAGDLAADRHSNLTFPPRAAGAYMLPISYENHCKACHPLTVALDKETSGKDRLLTIPHHLQPDEIRNLLWGVFVNEAIQANPDLRKPPSRPLPGHAPMSLEKKAREGTADKVQAAEKNLLTFNEAGKKVNQQERVAFWGKTTCGECHHYESKEGQIVPTAIVPPQVPAIWFVHAKFDHKAHRAVDCRNCHANAYALNADDSPNHEASEHAADVLVPGIETCVNCHAPAKGTGGVLTRGSARYECVECHLYHRGESDTRHYLLGAAAKVRDPSKRGTTESFLSGSLRPKQAEEGP
jgi:predicted CXXCH cytochrome family protein